MKADVVALRLAKSTNAAIIKDLAYKTWFRSYGEILSQEQILYMLKELYSEAALAQSIESKSQQFILLYHAGSPKGFAAYGTTADLNLKWHKIYVLPESQGMGFGKILIDYVKEKALSADCDFLELNVNRHNKAISFYKKLGFSIIKEVDIPIGPYWMNDYIMRMNLK